MALAIDASTPAYAAGSNDPWVTASFTPPNDSLLVVVVTGDWFGGTPTIAPVSSGLIFTSQGKFGLVNNGVIEIFTAPVGSSGGTPRTVSVTTTISSDVGGAKVYVVTDYYTDDPVETTGSNTGAPNGTNNWTPTVLTTAADGCWVFGGAVNWVGGNLASTSTDVFEEFNDADLSVMVARKSAATSPAGAVTLNFDQVAAGTPVWTYGAIAIRPSTYTPPAIHKVADRGSAQNITSQSSTAVDMAAGASITTGNYLIARIAMDNSGTSGAARTLSVSDTRSNTWTVTTGANRTAGTANDGSTVYIAYAKVTNAYSDGDDLTFTYSGAVVAKAIVVEEWTGIDGTTPVAVAATTATGSSTTPSISRTPAAAGQLFYGALGVEGPTGDTVTQDTDTTDGTWKTLTRLSTASGTAASNQTTNGVTKFVSGTSAQTWNPTITSRDWAQVALVFAAAAGGSTVNGTAAGSFGFTATATGVDRAIGSTAAAFGFTAVASGVDRAVGIAVASFGYTAAAAGVDRAVGAAATAFGFTATASGVAGTPPVAGHADGLFGFTGTASGVPRTRGAAVTSFGFAGSAAGVDRALGQAAAAFGFTATTSGRPRVVGLAVTSLGFTATAAGRPRARGAAIAVFGFTGSALGFAGHPPVTGQATSLFGFTATASGVDRAIGAAVAVFGYTSTASGRPRVRGHAVAMLGFTSTASGKVRVFAIASAPLGFTALVDGVGTPPYVPLTSPVASVRLNVAAVAIGPNPATASAAPNRSAATIRPNPAETT